MSRFVGLMVVGLGLFGASNAMAFSMARPTPAQQKKIASTITAAAKQSADYKQLVASGAKPVVKVTFSAAPQPKGFIGNGFLDANATIYTKGSMLPGQKPGLIGFAQRSYTVEGGAGNFKAVADGQWGHLFQAAAKPSMQQLTATPKSAIGE
jgi:hypothetical protein